MQNYTLPKQILSRVDARAIHLLYKPAQSLPKKRSIDQISDALSMNLDGVQLDDFLASSQSSKKRKINDGVVRQISTLTKNEENIQVSDLLTLKN